jgi:hypothetical protein
MKKTLEKIQHGLVKTFVFSCLAFVCLALCAEVGMVAIHFTNPEKESRLANEFAWKFDGTFKDQPGNIWYEAPKTALK